VKLSTFQVVENTNKQVDKRPLIAYCLERETLLFSIKMALIVGTVLALINHGQVMFTGHFTFDQLVPLLITYCVPFTVAMYSQVQGKRERDRLYAKTIAATKQPEIEATRSE
jgi:hypothetical protein